MARFKFKWRKAVQAIDFIARQKPNISHYYVGKIIFFADKEHVLDYGRPISGDRYVAMEHGPVPSAIRDIINLDSDSPDEILDYLDERVSIRRGHGNKLHLRSTGEGDLSELSETDKQYLKAATDEYSTKSFGALKDISHRDPAYRSAWGRPGLNNEMDIELWFDEGFESPEKAKEQLREAAAYSV